MTSVERVQEYTDLTKEEDNTTYEPPMSWPLKGEIEFSDISLRYFPDDPPVLKNLSFLIKANEKIGIVGRTGAGKTSLIQALFRMTHIDGKIFMDGIDTKTVSLEKLRSKMSIIPQEPVLFSGTLRKNLDPFDEYKDEVGLHNIFIVKFSKVLSVFKLLIITFLVHDFENIVILFLMLLFRIFGTP